MIESGAETETRVEAETSAGRRLCIFTRAPQRGRVKTRLAQDLGESGALAAHIELVEGTLSRCAAGSDYRIDLSIAGEAADQSVVDSWISRYPIELTTQLGADLGARMQHALERSLAKGALAVLIGSDCPDIDHDYVMAAFTALAEIDVVLGPAEDGGYGLIGLRRLAPELFSGIPWGSCDVLARTMEKAAMAGLTTRLLDEIYDVDTPADWQRYLALKPNR